MTMQLRRPTSASLRPALLASLRERSDLPARPPNCDRHDASVTDTVADGRLMSADPAFTADDAAGAACRASRVRG